MVGKLWSFFLLEKFFAVKIYENVTIFPDMIQMTYLIYLFLFSFIHHGNKLVLNKTRGTKTLLNFLYTTYMLKRLQDERIKVHFKKKTLFKCILRKICFALFTANFLMVSVLVLTKTWCHGYLFLTKTFRSIFLKDKWLCIQS